MAEKTVDLQYTKDPDNKGCYHVVQGARYVTWILLDESVKPGDWGRYRAIIGGKKKGFGRLREVKEALFQSAKGTIA